MASVTQSIPDKKALLVEYPGFVRNSDAAIQTLGGLDAISAITVGSSQMLSLYFRPGDPLSHPLLGYKQHTQGLLLRITRKTGQAGKADLTGHCSARQLFDFHRQCFTQWRPAVHTESCQADSGA